MGSGINYAWNNQRLQSMALFTGDYKSAQVGFGYDSVGRLAQTALVGQIPCLTMQESAKRIDSSWENFQDWIGEKKC
ncbi:MAG: hypothetical protein DWH95_12585 [Planctomycetota bacterium]|nr:MAG: hypothetical protein DWH95_12585 [Planctomycetota bacterium]